MIASNTNAPRNRKRTGARVVEGAGGGPERSLKNAEHDRDGA